MRTLLRISLYQYGNIKRSIYYNSTNGHTKTKILRVACNERRVHDSTYYYGDTNRHMYYYKYSRQATATIRDIQTGTYRNPSLRQIAVSD